MSLVLDALAGSWDTAGMTLCQISDCSVRPIRGLLPAQSINTNSGYMGMWHATRKPILLIGLFPKEISQHGETKGMDAHKTRGCGKSVFPDGSYFFKHFKYTGLLWEFTG